VTTHHGAGKTSSDSGDLTQLRRAPMALGGQNIARCRRGGEGVLLWPRLTLGQEFVKGRSRRLPAEAEGKEWGPALAGGQEKEGGPSEQTCRGARGAVWRMRCGAPG
jgi:hypothetical protein